MFLSVIIVAFNTSELTAVHVREVMNSSRIPDEIIVVNDCGDTKLLEMLKQLPRNTIIKYVYINPPKIIWNYNGAYNLGFWCSRGDILALEDSDHIPNRVAYENALNLFEDEKIGRVAFGRIVAPLEDVLNKPQSDWTHGHHIGGHENSTMLRREVFIEMKGNDERMCGQYGWIGYDWVKRRNRALDKLGLTTVKTSSYFLVQGGGCPDVEKPMSKINYRVFHQNSALGRIQHPEGILRFNYEITILK